MKAINESSKLVMNQLWEMCVNNDGHYKLNNDPTYMALSIEILDKHQITICHYGEQNGDLMCDPEMIFWKADNGDYFPFYFRNDYIGQEEYSCNITEQEYPVVFDQRLQADQTEFADIWLNNIKCQQEL